MSFYENIYDPSGDGKLIATERFATTITWNSIYFVDDGSYSVGPVLLGSGVEADFLSPCGRFPIACFPPNQIVEAELIGGDAPGGVPVPVPSPPIGRAEPLTLFGASLLWLADRYRRSGKRADTGPSRQPDRFRPSLGGTGARRLAEPVV